MIDGPVFRATVEHFERRSQSVKSDVKRLIKAAQAYADAVRQQHAAEEQLVEAIEQTQLVNPYVAEYYSNLDKATSPLHDSLVSQVQTLVIDPLQKIYDLDVKAVEQHKKEFDQESSDYYGFLAKHLSISADKRKKHADADSAYQQRKASFDLRLFDYYSFLYELHGGQKDQEISFVFSNLAEKHYSHHTSVAARIQGLRGLLDKLQFDMSESTRSMHAQKKEREGKRRLLLQQNVTSGETTTITDYPSPRLGGLLLDQLETSSPSAASLTSKEGCLFVVGGSSSKEWKRFWCVVSDGFFHEYTNWHKTTDTNIVIDLQTCTVREARNTDRRFTFEIIGPHVGTRVYQAVDADECRAWIATIQGTIEGLLLTVMSPAATSVESNTQQSLVHAVWSAEKSNRFCADCGQKAPDWCSINWLVVLCIDCSGVHRSMGTHVTKVRSLTLDTSSWTGELVALLKQFGNARVNRVLESKSQEAAASKPYATEQREIKALYIREKYMNKAFVDRRVLLQGKRAITATDMLVAAATPLNLDEAFQALALGASVDHGSCPVLHIACGFCNNEEDCCSPPLSPTADDSQQLLMFLELLLLHHGSSINAAERTTGRSILHYAAKQHKHALVAYCLAKGANALMQDALGKTPLDLHLEAASASASDTEERLREHMRRQQNL